MSSHPETFPYTYDGLVNWSPKLRSHSLVWRPLPQGRFGEIGIEIQGQDGPVDPTSIRCEIVLDTDFDTSSSEGLEPQEGEVIAIFEMDDIVRQGLGIYTLTLTPEHTRERGNVTARWTYTADGIESGYIDHLRVTEYMPTYHSLRDWEQGTVDTVMFMLGDLFDSTDGGPHLHETYQSRFGPERLAQLLSVSVTRMNTMGHPLTNFGSGPGTKELPQNLRGLMVIGLYIETLKHLVRSYVEQPEFRNQQVNYTDRRDYFQRWQTVLADETRDYTKSVALAKRSLLGLGRGSLLVSGGIYGSGRGAFKGTYGMQQRGARFWPSAPVVAGIVGGGWR